jgi:RimJ/RimL family protein N-acetyltransferase
MIRLETERLILRGWEERDIAPFAVMNADTRVMEHFPSVLTFEESRATVERLRDGAARHGFHFQPIEEKATGQFAGFVGIAPVPSNLPFAPAVEIGWRLPVELWGKGYASEAAAAWLDYAFDKLDLDEVVSFAVEANHRSRAVMSRIGMTQDIDRSFQHPALAADHSLALHVLYRIARTIFVANIQSRTI